MARLRRALRDRCGSRGVFEVALSHERAQARQGAKSKHGRAGQGRNIQGDSQCARHAVLRGQQRDQVRRKDEE